MLTDGLTNPIYGALARKVTATVADGTAEPVSVADLCNFARIDVEGGFELELIGKSIRESLEGQLEIATIPQTVTVIYEGPAYECRLPRVPFTSLTTVKEVTEGTAGSDISSEYFVDGDMLRRQSSAAIRQGVSLEVVYAAGYTTPPADIKLAILQLANDAFTIRNATVTGTTNTEVSGAGLDLLAHYMRP